MKIQENIPLAAYTTFKIGGPARFFCAVANEAELLEAVRFAQKEKLPFFVLGSGSNILVSDAGFPGVAIWMKIKGRTFTGSKGPTFFSVSVAAGEILDDFIEYAVNQGFYGLENLSAIPGTVGAAPVQNIGAYGAEVSNSIESVRVLDTKVMKFVELSNTECVFAYRDSIFKHEKGRYIIVSVNFRLSKEGKLNIDYKDLQEYFSQKSISEPTVSEVRQAIIEIRSKKLPDWRKWGTAGSFFKNPIVTADKFKELEKQYSGLLGFPEPDGRVKLSLAWILDKVCNVKGMKYGKAQVYEEQALVLVTMPGAMATDVVGLSRKLMTIVEEKTGVEIEGEVEYMI